MNTAARLASPVGDVRERSHHVVQGDYAVIDRPDIVLTTILGSCVATCMWDPVARVGGMNHFLVPGDEHSDSDALKYGVNAMELLINGLLQRGALRSRLQAKLFGGAQVVTNLFDIGAKNGEFAAKFLRLEGIPCAGQSLGGLRARRIRFCPMTGRAAQMLLDATGADVFSSERKVRAPEPSSAAGSIELFGD